MTKSERMRTSGTLAAMTLAGMVAIPAFAQTSEVPGGLIHEAEFQRLWAMNGDSWSEEDKEIDAKLAELEAKFGKKPNIIHILWDDMRYGAVGHRMLTDISGYDAPNLEQMAEEGMSFTRMYTEPSCTPTRVAAATGRLAVRSGMVFPIFPIHRMGLPASEVSIAEVVDDTYHTGFFEKAHFGDQEEGFVTNQGWDEAIFSLYNQFAGQMFNSNAEDQGFAVAYSPDGYDKKYFFDDSFRPLEWMWTVQGVEGGEHKEFSTPKSAEEYVEANMRMWDATKDFVTRHADSDKPFMLQWWPNVYEVSDQDANRPFTTQHATSTAESVKKMDAKIGELFVMLEELGIADNTLVIAMADNGPMEAIHPETGQNGFFRGGKNDVTEGGIRVPAFAKWPGVIEPGSVSGDIVHVSDLFNTFARISGRYDQIPTDRVIDGIDQTALFLNGDTHGRRDYVFTYKGATMGSIVKQQFKRLLPVGPGALAGAEFFDLYKDPREEHPLMAEFLWAWAQFDAMKARHDAQIAEYPHTPVARGEPYTGVIRLADQ
ncbi:sulfatase-like hydrolase/transferase [Tropicimonas sp. TH_r6]|uniref:sulfatase-like hydrolase/transferase n=1 Tax=Tropicimonas sp. TH_r6 TaxID=3082085 RepID=UPI0029559B9D|nr:sulfatase-like hydrolase/transferase [Tropicimonas sp. TH_r6]MDV7143859.1 sulfatase-like hydrolase/transferase [Tropicimonas sp. TH_r6]